MKTSLCDHMGPGLCFFISDLSTHRDEASVPHVSVVAEAAAIHQWLVSNGMSHLSLGLAASPGGAILFELLCFPDPSFDRLFVEGVSFYSGDPVARIGGTALSRVMVAKHWKAVRDFEVGACEFQRLYGEEVARSMIVNFAVMSEDGIRVIVRGCSHVSLPPLPPAIQWRYTSMYGEKDSDLRLTRRMIPRLYPEAELHVWLGWEYCERMSRDSVTYGVMLRNVALGSAFTDRL